MDAAQLEQAIAAPGGGLRDVTRIEIEIVDRRSLRWILWEGGRRLCSLWARPADIPAMLTSTRAILRALVGLDPAAADEEHATDHCRLTTDH